MGFVHGKSTYTSLDDSDISEFCNNVEFSRESDSHDTTTFGRDSKRYQGGLLDGTATLSGFYDDSESEGPAGVVEPMIGTNVQLVYRPEGTGDGKPEKTVEVLVTSYNETAPVADMITWESECQFSGDVEKTTQTSE